MITGRKIFLSGNSKKLPPHRRAFSCPPSLDLAANVLGKDKYTLSPPMPGYTPN